MEKRNQLLITVIGLSLTSQIYMNMFLDGFIVAVSPLFFTITLYLFREMNALVAGALAGTVATTFRIIMLAMRTGELSEAISLCWPDAFYFTAFGLFFLLFSRRFRQRTDYPDTQFFLVIFCCDMLSNIVEMSLRLYTFPADKALFQGILLIAGVRTLMTVLIVFGVNLYNSFLTRKDHEERYQKLMTTAAALNGEVYFMNKNMVEIEDVMEKAFTLYQAMGEREYPADLMSMSLDISKDVHEIKKDYIRVIRGIQDGFFADISTDGMEIKDIVKILNMDIQEQIRERRLNIVFHTKVRVHFYVEHHFSLMSILRNLVINSIDALEEKKRGRIDLVIDEDGEDYYFKITDDGSGISDYDMELIFTPGYSTKFNEETGDIYRGVGLSLVKDLLKDRFSGEIQVESTEGEGTQFLVRIAKAMFVGETE